MIKRDLIIIGGGAAGLAAALSAYDNGVRDIVILEKEYFLGGILNQCIHQGFGLHYFKEQLTGPEYAERFVLEIEKRGIEYHLATTVFSLDKDRTVIYSNEEQGLVVISAKAVIQATGCYERTAGQIQIIGDRPEGIYTAGIAQRLLNIDGFLVGKRVFILGSGDIGLIMARRMTLEGAKVLGVAEIQSYSSGLNRNIVQCLQDFEIPLFLSHTVSKVIGKKKLEKVIISEVDQTFTPILGTEKVFEVDVLLLSVGLIPMNDLLGSIEGVHLSKTKGVIVNESMESEISGIFSCGNSLHVHDLVDYVSEESLLAGKCAAKYLRGEIKETTMQINVEAKKGISYIVPQVVRYDNLEESLKLRFRVTRPYENVVIIVKADNKIIKKIKKIQLLPAEMEVIDIKKIDLSEIVNVLSVEVEEQ